MIRIKRLFDDLLPNDRLSLKQVQDILRTHFTALSEKDVQKIQSQLLDPLEYRFRSILFVAEGVSRNVKGFALMMHAPDLNFSYLDFIAANPNRMGGGIGGALYSRVRQEARLLDSLGLFLECLPDDLESCPCPELIAENKARLRFYERYDARPIMNTAYEAPMGPDSECMPHLIYDHLDTHRPLSKKSTRKVVRAVLERKYKGICPPGYVEMVVASITDDPVRVRPPRYQKSKPTANPRSSSISSTDQSIALVVSDKHQIHHVHERGYVESPVRIRSIIKELEKTPYFDRIPVRHFSEKHITAVHNKQFVAYLKKVCTKVPPEKSIYPYVFPIRNAARPPRELPVRAGYYCIDVFTPLNQNAFDAAKRAVDCALTAADTLCSGYMTAYALVRPPGHHAERNVFGGFCYFNSSAIAANYLTQFGKVAVLDVDYHHGNGTQDIFYRRSDVLTVSIHGHPRFAYPYFSGFEDEKGEGEGLGFNRNFPLAEDVDGEKYRKYLARALSHIKRFQPRFLIVALGLDPAKNDPTGTWSLAARDFFENGRMIGRLNCRKLVVQEGGYRIRSIGVNARLFFQGLLEAFQSVVRDGTGESGSRM